MQHTKGGVAGRAFCDDFGNLSIHHGQRHRRRPPVVQHTAHERLRELRNGATGGIERPEHLDGGQYRRYQRPRRSSSSRQPAEMTDAPRRRRTA
jgi:hypothetical protein